MVVTADVAISMGVMITIMLWPVQRVVLVGRRLKVQRGAREVVPAAVPAVVPVVPAGRRLKLQRGATEGEGNNRPWFRIYV